MELGDFELTWSAMAVPPGRRGHVRRGAAGALGEGKPPDERNRIRMAHQLPAGRARQRPPADRHRHRRQARAQVPANYAMEPGPTRLPDSIRQAGYELGGRHPRPPLPPPFRPLRLEHPRATGDRPDRADLPQRALLAAARRGRARPQPERARPGELLSRATGSRSSRPGVVELFGDEAEPIPGVRAVRTPGHNADMCIVLIDGGGRDEQGGLLGRPGADRGRTSPTPGS